MYTSTTQSVTGGLMSQIEFVVIGPAEQPGPLLLLKSSKVVQVLFAEYYSMSNVTLQKKIVFYRLTHHSQHICQPNRSSEAAVSQPRLPQ